MAMTQHPKDLPRLINIADVFDHPYNLSLADYHSLNGRNTSVLQTKHCLEIVVIGEKSVFYNEKSAHLVAGQIQFRRDGRYEIRESRNFRSFLFFFNSTFLKEFLEQNIKTLNLTYSHPSQEPFVATSFSEQNFKAILLQVEGILEEKLFAPCFTRNTLQQIFLTLLSEDKIFRLLNFLFFLTRQEKTDLLYLMNRYLFEDLSNKELATLSGRSLSVFNHEFKKQFQQTPQKWIYSRRLEKADQLIKTTSKNITEICFEVGFKDLTHFIKAFKKKYGVSPKQLQKKFTAYN